MAVCPHGCGSSRMVYKCDNCGEVRCSNLKCPGMNKQPKAAASNGTCKACRKGKYKKLL